VKQYAEFHHGKTRRMHITSSEQMKNFFSIYDLLVGKDRRIDDFTVAAEKGVIRVVKGTSCIVQIDMEKRELVFSIFGWNRWCHFLDFPKLRSYICSVDMVVATTSYGCNNITPHRRRNN